MKKQIKVMLSQVLYGFLYVQKPISILMMLIFIILLLLGAITKYGGNYEAGVEYKQKYIVEKQGVTHE
ncbi:hypothetical protein Megvenef_00531 [Candidatus Megaera venefica]|uniref:Uncharacterized protein n=1 Tax=Candidatus Megaera venefica TaxID=2055910 RepID=A0ABU5NBL9_9RICK|nr:hypothetical protein [Candidatus Megaera venefica]MEA0970565.1 hypothetical protein [Candidatus Megaera venefica]